jgi:hypothetical protein
VGERGEGRGTQRGNGRHGRVILAELDDLQRKPGGRGSGLDAAEEYPRYVVVAELAD